MFNFHPPTSFSAKEAKAKSFSNVSKWFGFVIQQRKVSDLSPDPVIFVCLFHQPSGRTAALKNIASGTLTALPDRGEAWGPNGLLLSLREEYLPSPGQTQGKDFPPHSAQPLHDPHRQLFFGKLLCKNFPLTMALFVFEGVSDKALCLFQSSLVEMTRGNNTVFRGNAPLQALLLGSTHFSFQPPGRQCCVPCASHHIHFGFLPSSFLIRSREKIVYFFGFSWLDGRRSD